MNQRDPFKPMVDVQSLQDTRQIAIDRVGIKSVRHPVRIRTQNGEIQHTVAYFSLSVKLPDHVKGTHMSRFIELLQAHHAPLDAAMFPALLAEMATRLGASEGYIEARFPYFLEKSAPVSAVKSLLDYEVTLSGHIRHAGSDAMTTEVSTQVMAPVTSLCPCSREISAYGAHNQRSHITIAVSGAQPIAVEEIIRIAEQQASSELYGILKRSDEKYVTERAYDNPKFVEDLVRDIAAVLDADARIMRYSIEAENFESIHNHSAFAVIQRDKSATL
ncbi:MAG: GTP cyclohydrolase I FolE2 [Betaproteobacteria bacterium]|nr:GTP cyclohydrolase I FolE2 [Betaproteobacteria bacterium]